jgi:predicted RNase H-like HicB family nuclease
VAEHKVVYRRGGKGEWVASVEGVRRCRGRGRTLRQARQHLRAALARVVEDPYEIDFVEDVRLPPPARRLILQHWAARRRLAKERARADEAAGAALQALVSLKLNLKDASDLLGLPPLKLQKLRGGQKRSARQDSTARAAEAGS